MDLDVIIPVWGRPELLRPLADSLRDTTPVDYDLIFVLSPNDPAGLTADTVIAEAGAGRVVMASWSGGRIGDYARKINLGYESGSSPWLFLGATDLIFQPGWWEAVQRLMDKPSVQVIGTNDGGNVRTANGQHSTHSLVARAYIDEFGTIDRRGVVLHPGYWHEYCDDEFVHTAKFRHVWAHAPDALVEHLHPHWGKREPDEHDAQWTARMAHGKALYRQRQALWGHGRRGRPAAPVQYPARGRPPRVVRRG